MTPHTYFEELRLYFKEREMKHLLKTVVLLVIALLAAQPVLSSLNCAAGAAPACVPGCPMAMGSMGPNCSMSGISAAAGCQQDCCTRHAADAVLLPASRDKSKITLHTPVAAFASTFAEAGQDNPIADSFDPRADSPPRYIMNSVFRI